MNRFEKARAQQYFDVYPDAVVIYVTSDGQIFLQTNHNDAVNHQASLTRQDPAAKMTAFYKKDLDSPTDEDLEELKEEEEEEDLDQDKDEQDEDQPVAEQPAAEPSTEQPIEEPASELPAEQSRTNSAEELAGTSAEPLATDIPATDQPASGRGRGGNKRNRN